MRGTRCFACTIAASMTPRRLPLDPRTIVVRTPQLSELAGETFCVGWTRKAFALALHMTCLGLFALVVVWPLVSSVSSGALAREFGPALDAWTCWTSSPDEAPARCTLRR